ncbi:molybdopterin molybdotransferase [Desulfuromusa kysingii]|uniref:Molybdopterin molybdenumtransferase n=1 Tax=Desulfuromusa kysingii TaxID=37625 RepID=A0A1H4CWS6_9BACT|nr:molybdopterin molybdotransferase MoeA [Desulfuromusa kysingii]SEA64686.1 molybdopterin molybdotransferase [Desulfuromusa kysingii]
MMPEKRPLPLPDAQQVLIDAVIPVGTEMINSVAALGRVLAEDIFTPHPFPDTRRSAVDGFAVNQPGLSHYQIVETLGAGELPQLDLTAGQAAAVMTGATVPEGGVAVIRVEDTGVTDNLLELKADVAVGENINRIGEEMAAETRILSAGTRLTPVQHSVLCCSGIAQVKVYRLPVVGILITGDEVLQVGQPHRVGSVYDSNRHFLSGCLAQLGVPYKVLGPVNDDADTIRQSLEQLAKECDLVISSGGVSMGKYDFIRPLLHSNGFEVLVNRTGIKPGRPLIVAQRDATLFFGMPGYPAAFLVNFFYYLLPTVKRLMGVDDVMPKVRPAVLATPLKGRKGRWDVIRVQLDNYSGPETVHKLASQMTSHYLNFGSCDGLVLLGDEIDQRQAGESVELLEFSAQF